MPDYREVIVPQTNPNDELAILVRWHVASGSPVDAGDTLATLETTKATFELVAPEAGYAHYFAGERSQITVGSAVAWIGTTATPPPASIAGGGDAAPPVAASGRFSRKALRLMKEHGLQESDFPGTAPVRVADVEQALRGDGHPATTAGTDEFEPLEQPASKLIEVRQLVEVYSGIVPSSVTVRVEHARTEQHLGKIAAEHGPISLLELAIHECAQLLPGYPDLNGFHTGQTALRYTTVNIGFAINAGRSLKVPVIRETSQHSLIEIARAVRELSMSYMRDELQAGDLTGGTFTITDLSSRNVTDFSPVLNIRQSAILGICSPAPEADSFNLVLGFDHRMSDGMRAALFLNELRAGLEACPGA